MQKLEFRPWVKMSIAFVIGVFIVAKITAAIDTHAVDSGAEFKTVHGIVSMNSDGQAHVRTIDGAYELDIVLPLQKEYVPMEMVTVTLDGDNIVHHWKSSDEEVSAVMESERDMIETIRESVYRANFE